MSTIVEQKYPWDGFPPKFIHGLLGAEPADVAAKNVALAMIRHTKVQVREGDEVGVEKPLEAIARWLRSKDRRLIQVSPEAQDLLIQVSETREQAGFSAVRWNDIPNPGSPYYDRPLMLYFEGGSLTSTSKPMLPLFVFIQSVGQLFAEKLLFQCWYPNIEHRPFRGGLLKVQIWLPFTGTRFVIDRHWWEQNGEAALDVNYDLIMFWLAANTLAALSSEQRIPILRQRRGGKSRKVTAGNVRGVSSFELDLTGLFAWRKAYINSPDLHRATNVEYPDHRASPVLHYVEEHYATYWVREANVQEGEVVLETHITEQGVTLCAVRRKKVSHARGEGIEPMRERMRVGLDDLDTRKL